MRTNLRGQGAGRGGCGGFSGRLGRAGAVGVAVELAGKLGLCGVVELAAEVAPDPEAAPVELVGLLAPAAPAGAIAGRVSILTVGCPDNAKVTSTVGIGPRDEGGFGLDVAVTLLTMI